MEKTKATKWMTAIAVVFMAIAIATGVLSTMGGNDSPKKKPSATSSSPF